MIDPETYYSQQQIFHSRRLERESSPLRPGTPPPSRLMQSAPMRIPKSKHSKFDEDIEDNTTNLSKSVPLSNLQNSIILILTFFYCLRK